MIRFLGLSGRELPLKLLVFWTQNCLKFKWRREILFCGHAVLDDGIPVNSATFANEETWFKLIGVELLVEHSHTAGGFAEAAGTELCKGNVE